MASLSLRSFYPPEETSTLLDFTLENASDYERLKVLTFKKLSLKTLEEVEEQEVESLLSQYR